MLVYLLLKVLNRICLNMYEYVNKANEKLKGNSTENNEKFVFNKKIDFVINKSTLKIIITSKY
jgi:hypothetical protein